ncbi:MAG: glucose-6-phosphate isomerase [Clostridiales bacterium]|jgi:glucose-6-phosphate isomerase|nr:glucose-6-phosphate isomerase [Clostridiales bacterium]
MQLKFDFSNMYPAAIGAEQGIDPAGFRRSASEIAAAHAAVVGNRGKGWQEWTELPFSQDEAVADIIDYAKSVRGRFDSVVVFGIGGSALGPLTVAYSLLHLHHNELPKRLRKAPKYYIEDNVDPERMAALLDVIDPAKTLFNVVTKSGETSETLSQFLIVLDILKAKTGADFAKNIVVTTTKGKGTLYEAAVRLGLKTFGVGKGVGGRFSVLSPVGLLPFALLGLDIKKILKGARAFSKSAFSKNIDLNPALASAFLQTESMRRGKNISVLMPYADSLKYMADFYCQIWGESLGKAVDLRGNTVHAGQTPAKALGVTDQHSQIQLYTEGPFDKVVTFIGVEAFRKSVTIPQVPGFDGISFLQNKTLDTLINAERVATAFALTKAQRANFTITLPAVTPETVGELLAYFMYETAFTGALLRVDTYNQPGVEEGKLATFAMLGRKGYEDKLAEIKAVR